MDRDPRPSGGSGAELDREILFGYLNGQREAALAILDGLPEALLRKSVVPSGWTPIGLLEHLTGAEFFWIEVVATGATGELGEEDSEGDDYTPADAGAFTSDLPVAEVLDGYRARCAKNDELLAATALDAPVQNRPGWVPTTEHCDLRWVLLHLIEETARHAGHLDIARELLDGATGLGAR